MSELEMQVRDRLRGLRLSETEREEVFAEISAHLELVIEELQAAGLNEKDALLAALSQLGDHKMLLKRIQRAKERTMRDSFRKLWLPAAVVVLLTYVSQMVIYRFITEPRAYRILGTYYAFSWGWLLTVGCTGALGAWWSREVGGSLRERLVVALAPAEAMAVVVALVLPVDAITQVFVEHRAPVFVSHPLMVLAAVLWVLHSAVPSFIGAVPFLRGSAAEPTETAS